MSIMNLLRVIFSIIVFQQSLDAASLLKPKFDPESLKGLHFLGTIQLENGALVKQYWADNETRSWDDSKLFCESIGSEFTLATMKSEREVDVLKVAYSNTSFVGTHWVSAALAEPLVMSWVDALNDTVDLGVPWENSLTSTICAGFYSNGTTSYLRALDCSFSERVICMRTEHHQTDDPSIPTGNELFTNSNNMNPGDMPLIGLGSIPKSLSYLGTIELENGGLSKQYWADDVARNWTNSRLFCESIGTGFSLATMKTEDEVDVLRAAYSSTGFSGTHWMSAVLAEPERSMAWVDEENDFIGDVGVPWKNSVELPICGAYYSNREMSYFRALDCSLNYKVICVLSERRFVPSTTDDSITEEPTTEWFEE